MTHITLTLLREHNACKEQINLFEELFGDSAELNQENWNLAIEKELDVLWLLNVLPNEKKEEYQKIQQPAWEEYLKIQQPALFEILVSL